MRKSTIQKIQESKVEGYVLLAEGTGIYDEHVAEYRRLGYDVRAWYTKNTKDAKEWTLYGKMKVRASRKQKVVTVDYNSMTVKELRKICSQKKIPNYSKLTKAEIISKLSEAC